MNRKLYKRRDPQPSWNSINLLIKEKFDVRERISNYSTFSPFLIYCIYQRHVRTQVSIKSCTASKHDKAKACKEEKTREYYGNRKLKSTCHIQHIFPTYITFNKALLIIEYLAIIIMFPPCQC